MTARPKPREWPHPVDLEIAILELLLEKGTYLSAEFIADKCAAGNVAAVLQPLADMVEAGIAKDAGAALELDSPRAGMGTRILPLAEADARLRILRGTRRGMGDRKTKPTEGEPMEAEPKMEPPMLYAKPKGAKQRAIFDQVIATPGQTARQMSDGLGHTKKQAASDAATLTLLRNGGFVRSEGKPLQWYPTRPENAYVRDPAELLTEIHLPDDQPSAGAAPFPMVSVERDDPSAPPRVPVPVTPKEAARQASAEKPVDPELNRGGETVPADATEPTAGTPEPLTDEEQRYADAAEIYNSLDQQSILDILAKPDDGRGWTLDRIGHQLWGMDYSTTHTAALDRMLARMVRGDAITSRYNSLGSYLRWYMLVEAASPTPPPLLGELVAPVTDDPDASADTDTDTDDTTEETDEQPNLVSMPAPDPEPEPAAEDKLRAGYVKKQIEQLIGQRVFHEIELAKINASLRALRDML